MVLVLVVMGEFTEVVYGGVVSVGEATAVVAVDERGNKVGAVA